MEVSFDRYAFPPYEPKTVVPLRRLVEASRALPGTLMNRKGRSHPSRVRCSGIAGWTIGVRAGHGPKPRDSKMITPKVSILAGRGGHPILITADRIRVETPPVEHLAFYVGIGAVAAAEIIEWPVALILATGHVLIGLTHRPALKELGEALGEV